MSKKNEMETGDANLRAFLKRNAPTEAPAPRGEWQAIEARAQRESENSGLFFGRKNWWPGVAIAGALACALVAIFPVIQPRNSAGTSDDELAAFVSDSYDYFDESLDESEGGELF